MNWPGLITAAAVWAFFMLTVVWPICTSAKANDHVHAPRPARVVVIGEPSNHNVSNALAKATEDYLNRGGNLDDIVSWYPTFHPSGAVVVTLVTAADVVDEAEAIVRGTV